MNPKITFTRQIALGGLLAALAIVIMSLGGMIPAATYVCPMLCILAMQVVVKLCSSRIAWAWYGAVSILGLLLAADREGAATFLFLGYYPIVKPWFDRRHGKWLWKLLLFNGSIGVMYWLLCAVMGISELVQEYAELGVGLTVLLVLLGNVTFFLLDRVLDRDVFRKLEALGK